MDSPQKCGRKRGGKNYRSSGGNCAIALGQQGSTTEDSHTWFITITEAGGENELDGG